MTAILGVSAYYHDSAACLVRMATLWLRHRRNDLRERSMIPGFLTVPPTIVCNMSVPIIFLTGLLNKAS
jgi:hypothetical protein